MPQGALNAARGAKCRRRHEMPRGALNAAKGAKCRGAHLITRAGANAPNSAGAAQGQIMPQTVQAQRCSSAGAAAARQQQREEREKKERAKPCLQGARPAAGYSNDKRENLQCLIIGAPVILNFFTTRINVFAIDAQLFN